MLLTPEERAKFIAYCKQEAQSLEAIIRQMATMPGDTMAQLAKVKRAQVTAYLFVVRDMESVQDGTLGGN